MLKIISIQENAIANFPFLMVLQGDVKNVWRKFKEHFANVVGVAGNHDDFGEHKEFENFKREKGIIFLQKETKKVENIEISGISGIIGQIDKPNRIEK